MCCHRCKKPFTEANPSFLAYSPKGLKKARFVVEQVGSKVRKFLDGTPDSYHAACIPPNIWSGIRGRIMDAEKLVRTP